MGRNISIRPSRFFFAIADGAIIKNVINYKFDMARNIDVVDNSIAHGIVFDSGVICALYLALFDVRAQLYIRRIVFHRDAALFLVATLMRWN